MKTIVGIFAYNEGEKIQAAIARHPAKRDYTLMVIDDGSTDNSLNNIPDDVKVMTLKKNRGIGYAMKMFLVEEYEYEV